MALRMLAIAAAFAIVIAIATGCASVGRKLDQGAVNRIQIGETTREQVLSWLGSPDQVMRNGEGETIFSYLFVRYETDPKMFIPIVGLFAGGANIQNQMARVTFGPDGVVKEVVSSFGDLDSETGLDTASKADLDFMGAAKRPK